MGGARTTTTAKSVPTLETSVRGPDGMKSARREVGRARSRGYGRARGHGCWCRRKRRPARRRTSVMGNMVCLTFAVILVFLKMYDFLK
ncbi:hypothetical protein O3G_MSEX014482 [Manduca sexta]|uniref:Transmembrane protein n=1 Tax=Manduca sexta TaxID=7130 RepID=A0A921ZJ28_MANSE|nr:hypothetical protein O3G_MSEX010899 [Manduca sexta]KAG6464391.1 hypothetical protein O3G_MSEX014482 [Manduca sexta]